MNSQPSASPRPAKEFVATQRRIYENAETGPADGFLFPPDPPPLPEDIILSVLDLTQELEKLGVIEIYKTPSGADAYRIVDTKAGKCVPKQIKGGFTARVAAIFRRRSSTLWSREEIKAYRQLSIDPIDLALVEEYYRSEAGRENNFCRTSLLTFLRHYSGEVDRARRWKDNSMRRHSY